MKRLDTRKLVLSALFLALCLVLPFLTMQIPEIGSMLSPMHIPVLLCGFVCGWGYGAAVGLIAPLLRSLLFSMPPMFPTAAAMALELAAYGAISGLMYAKLPGKRVNIYVSLIVAMLAGRAVWGLARLAFTGVTGSPFTFSMFLAGAFVNAVPAIVLHILLIPLIVMALQRAKLMPDSRV